MAKLISISGDDKCQCGHYREAHTKNGCIALDDRFKQPDCNCTYFNDGRGKQNFTQQEFCEWGEEKYKEGYIDALDEIMNYISDIYNKLKKDIEKHGN